VGRTRRRICRARPRNEKPGAASTWPGLSSAGQRFWVRAEQPEKADSARAVFVHYLLIDAERLRREAYFNSGDVTACPRFRGASVGTTVALRRFLAWTKRIA
jgi:hypothetical protein